MDQNSAEMGNEESDPKNPETKKLSTREVFTELTGIEPIEEQETHARLKAQMRQRSQQVLEPWRNLELIDDSEVSAVGQAWENAVLLDDPRMEQFADYQSGIYKQAIEELSSLDEAGENLRLQELVKKAKLLVQSIESTCKAAGALTFRPDTLQIQQSGLTQIPESIIIINSDKLDPKDTASVNAAASEETAHLVSKLDRYDGCTKKWLEETMARVVVVGTDALTMSQDQDTRKRAAEILRLDSYTVLYQMLKRQSGDDGTTLARMYFGKEPPVSDQVKKVKKAVQEMDLIGQLIDAGVSPEELQKQLNT